MKANPAKCQSLLNDICQKKINIDLKFKAVRKKSY